MVTTAISPLSSQNPLQTPEVKPKSNPAPDNFNKMLVHEKSKLNQAMNQRNPHAISKQKLRSEMHSLRKADPTIEESYSNIMDPAKTNELDEAGTKIALKELAKQFGNQFTSILWHEILKKETGSLSEKLWSSERNRVFMEQEEELNDFEEHIYTELLEEWKAKNMIGGK